MLSKRLESKNGRHQEEIRYLRTELASLKKECQQYEEERVLYRESADLKKKYEELLLENALFAKERADWYAVYNAS